MTSMTSTSSSPLLTSDEIDDLIYDARTGDLASLKENVASLGHKKGCPVSVILQAAIDVDEDGLGSGSSLLHYPAANGNLEVVEYLLSHAADVTDQKDGHEEVLQSQSQQGQEIVQSDNVQTTTTRMTKGKGNSSSTTTTTTTTTYVKFVNHQNVSGNTPLHWAGVNGHLAVVKALMKAGADPGIVNGAGRDAVFESDVSSKEGAAECAVEMLKAYEALERVGEPTGGDTKEEEDGDENEERVTATSDMV